MIYCISDLHGDYNKYSAMIERLNLTDDDTVFVLGDILDRCNEPMRILKDMMCNPNIIPLAGNHDMVAAHCLKLLSQEITEESLENLDTNSIQVILEWLADGGEASLKDFRALPPDERMDILDYISDFELYTEISVNGQDYILTHAGLGNFSDDKQLEDYTIEELLFMRTDYSKKYFKDKILITGHTPTWLIPENMNPGYIYKGNNHIAIDCGAGFGGRLGAICIDTGEEFYV